MSAILLTETTKDSATKKLNEMGFRVVASKKVDDKRHAFAVRPHYLLFPVKRNLESLNEKLYSRKLYSIKRGFVVMSWYDNPKGAEENIKFFNGFTEERKLDEYSQSNV